MDSLADSRGRGETPWAATSRPKTHDQSLQPFSAARRLRPRRISQRRVGRAAVRTSGRWTCLASYFYPDVPGRSSNRTGLRGAAHPTPAGVKWVTFDGTQANSLSLGSMGVDAEKIIPVKFNAQAVG